MLTNILLVLIIYVVFVICINNMGTYEYFEPGLDEVPKIVWAYWDSDDVPDFVNLCLKNWRKLAPNYKINFLNKNNVENYIQLPKDWKLLRPYRQADIIRLLLLEKYGGIWMDASIILLKKPEKFISKNNITLFTTPNCTLSNPVFENWFISTPPNNKIIKQWAKEAIIAINNKDEYIKNSPEYSKKAVDNCTYLICHLVLKNIYEKNKDLFDGVKIYESNETAFYYHRKNNWEKLNTLLENKFDEDRLMVKFRKRDRSNLDIGKFDKKLL